MNLWGGSDGVAHLGDGHELGTASGAAHTITLWHTHGQIMQLLLLPMNYSYTFWFLIVNQKSII